MKTTFGASRAIILSLLFHEDLGIHRPLSHERFIRHLNTVVEKHRNDIKYLEIAQSKWEKIATIYSNVTANPHSQAQSTLEKIMSGSKFEFKGSPKYYLALSPRV